MSNLFGMSSQSLVNEYDVSTISGTARKEAGYGEAKT